jgi:hypothetical protein
MGIGLFGFVWWFGIALETNSGFSGNNRYLVLGTAPIGIAGGIAWGWFSRTLAVWIRRLAGVLGSGVRRLAAPVFTVPAGVVVAILLFLTVPEWFGRNIVSIPRTHHALVYQAHLREDLAAAVRKAGGAGALLNCGPVMTEGFQVPMVAWNLGVRTLRIQAPPSKLVGPPYPAVILQTRAQSNATLLPTPAQIIAWEHAGANYKLIAHVRTFRVFSTCAGKASG